MFTCKVCDKTFMFARASCPYCYQYSFNVVDKVVESETVKSGNFHLVFLPTYKHASVVQVDGEEPKRLHSFEMLELTADLAKQWVKKLKNYLIFQ